MFRFLKRILSPTANEELWTITEEMINQHEKVYINLCRYYNEDKSKSIKINPQGLLKYRLLGASFPSSAYRFAFCKDKPGLSSEVEERSFALATKPFSLHSKEPFILDPETIKTVGNHTFKFAQRHVIESFSVAKIPTDSFKALHAMHYDALFESISDRDYLDAKEAIIAGSITAPMEHVTQFLD